MSLDERLKELMIERMVGDMSKIFTFKNASKSPEELSKMVMPKIDEAIAQIKQAFADEGWTPELGFISKNIYGLMTGQEWYERFERELLNTSMFPNDAGSVDWDAGQVVEAAKRASGLEEK